MEQDFKDRALNLDYNYENAASAAQVTDSISKMIAKSKKSKSTPGQIGGYKEWRGVLILTIPKQNQNKLKLKLMNGKVFSADGEEEDFTGQELNFGADPGLNATAVKATVKATPKATPSVPFYKNKKVLIGAGIVAVGIIAFVVWKRSKK